MGKKEGELESQYDEFSCNCLFSGRGALEDGFSPPKYGENKRKRTDLAVNFRMKRKKGEEKREWD